MVASVQAANPTVAAFAGLSLAMSPTAGLAVISAHRVRFVSAANALSSATAVKPIARVLV